MSCSPYRVPIARLAAAQAAAREARRGLSRDADLLPLRERARSSSRSSTPELLTEIPEALHWIDLEDPTVKEATILEDPFHFHPLAIEDCLSEVHHPKVDDYEAYIFAIVHGIRFDAPTDQFITRELDIFLGPNYLITHHNGPMRSITAVRDQCSKNLQAAMPRGVDFLLHQILDQMFEHYFPSLDAIEDKIQLVQVEVFENPTPRDAGPDLHPQEGRHAAAAHLPAPARDREPPGPRRVQGHQRPRRRLLPRHLRQPVPHRGRRRCPYQDMMQSTMDAYLSAVSNRLNETMKRLTVDQRAAHAA